MFLFDSHCHLDMEEFSGEIGDVLARAREVGVVRVLAVSCDEASSRDVLKLAGEFGDSGVEILTSVGIHPHETEGALSPDGDLPRSLTDLSSDRSVVAIGETGLDFYYDNAPRAVQAEVFERQILWAREAEKPIIVHLRSARNRTEGDAYIEAISIMRLNKADECGGVIHCFSGGKRDARAALDLGFYISFAGPVTFPKADELREAAGYIPLDRMLCETDSPYLAPQGRRGKRNEPAFVLETYEKLAEVRNIPMSELAGAIWENGERLFLKSVTPENRSISR